MTLVDTESKQKKVNADIPKEVRAFFQEKIKGSKKYKNTVDFILFYLDKYIEKPQLFKQDKNLLLELREQIGSDCENNVNIKLPVEKFNVLQSFSFANFRTVKQEFSLFLHLLYLKLKKQ